MISTVPARLVVSRFTGRGGTRNGEIAFAKSLRNRMSLGLSLIVIGGGTPLHALWERLYGIGLNEADFRRSITSHTTLSRLRLPASTEMLTIGQLSSYFLCTVARAAATLLRTIGKKRSVFSAVKLNIQITGDVDRE